MKLTAGQLRRIIQEELSRVVSEAYDASDDYGYSKEDLEELGKIVGLGYEEGKSFMKYWAEDLGWTGLEDMDDLFMFLNGDGGSAILGPGGGMARYGDKLGSEGVEELLSELELELPILDPDDALRIYSAAKSPGHS